MKIAFELVAAVAIASFTLAPWALAQEEKKVKDQAEYDIFQSATTETDPAKKIELLKTWKEKYADSDYKNDRLMLMIQTYQQLGQGENMWATAVELNSAPNKNATENLTANYYLTQLTASLNNTTPDRLKMGEAAANGLIGLLPETFSAARKPATVTDEAWKGEQQKMEILARKTLAFVATSRQQWPAVEAEIVKLLAITPDSGQLSYQLATAILQQKSTERQEEAMYHLARSAYNEGPEPLAPEAKQQVQKYFQDVYTKYVGSENRMQDVINLAKASIFPPAGFNIETDQELEFARQEKIRLEDPQKYVWLQVRQLLEGENSATYFTGQLKGTSMPRLKGTVVSATPATRPERVVVAVTDSTTPEITLRLDDRLRGDLRPGQTIEFAAAVPQEFTAQPFMLICDISREQLN